jgi:hypothetical protein
MSQLLANTQTIAAIARERLSCPNENFSCLPDLKIGNREQVFSCVLVYPVHDCYLAVAAVAVLRIDSRKQIIS